MYNSTQTNHVIAHIKDEYGIEPEFLWPERHSTYSVYRHSDNRKWFALIGVISSTSLGIEDDNKVEVINLKFDKNQAPRLCRKQRTHFPGLSHE